MRWLALLSLEALVGCGSSEHFEKNFVGVWNGSAEIVTPSYYQVLNSTHINIAAVGENHVRCRCVDLPKGLYRELCLRGVRHDQWEWRT